MLLSLVALTQGVPQALAMLVICIVYQQVENYVLQPTIQGRAADISGFFVIASVIVGAALLGVVGAIIAVPLTASVADRDPRADRRAAGRGRARARRHAPLDRGARSGEAERRVRL